MPRRLMQLNAGCPPGQSQPLFVINPDGTSTPFNLPPGESFNVTDISIVIANLSSSTPVEVLVGLRQVVTGGHVQRWNLAGYIVQNVERSFTTPIVFAKIFEVWNPSNTYLNVNIFGYPE
jgi:hypothetical protein